MNRSRKILQCLLMVLMACLIVLAILWQESRQTNLAVHFFDVGQGDCIYIRTPAGQDILIDGGPDVSVLSKIGRAMPFYDHTIELVVLTHAHSDHIAGLVPVLERYTVEEVLYTGVSADTVEYRTWMNLITDRNIPVRVAQTGVRYQFDEVSFEVLYPRENISNQAFEDLNESSIVMRLSFGETDFLLTGDAPVEIEERLLSQGRNALDAEVLKAGHHGSRYSNSVAFVQAVDPEYVVVQSGEDNSFDHPHEIALRRLGSTGAEVLRNDTLGDIVFESNGKGVWVRE